MRKSTKFAAVLTSAMLLPWNVMTVSAAATKLAGDVDHSGDVNVNDVILLSRYVTEDAKAKIDEAGLVNADMDRNECWNTDDVNAILRLIAGIDKPEDYAFEDEKEEEKEVIVPERDPAYLHLNGSSITFEGENVSVSGSTATISASGSYYLDGTLNGGQVIVNVPDEKADPGTVKLFLQGVNMTNDSAPVIMIENAENTSINLAEDTENVLSDGTTEPKAEEADHAVLHAKDDMTIKGDGKLTIQAGTQYGIHCGNDLKINGGVTRIETLNADAVRGKTSVTIKSGTLEIDSEGDGIKSTQGSLEMQDGNVTIKAGNDAVQAETNMVISGGNLLACGDRGLTAAEGIDISGGSVLATATDEPSAEIANAMQLSFTKEWSKNNPISVTDQSGDLKFEKNTHKKFRYATVFDENIADGCEVYAGGIAVQHDGSGTFDADGSYENVNNTTAAKLLYAPLFDQSQVHKVEIEMADWNNFIANADKEEYVSATVTVDGERFENVGVRTKGYSSLMFVSQAKHDKFSLRIQFNKFDKLQNYHGLTEICLNNMYSDPSCMRDTLCYNALHDLGGYAPNTAYSDLYVNGSLYSFYFLAEQPGTTLAERYATSDDACFYKANSSYCTMESSMKPTELDLKFGDDVNCDHIAELTRAINNFNPNQPQEIEKIMDVSSFLKGFAVNAVMCNYDSYNGQIAHNYYLQYDQGKFYYVGWDYNLCLGNFMDYGASVNSDILTALYSTTENERPMVSNLLKNEAYKKEYVGYVREIVEMYSDPQPVVDGIASTIRSHVKADPRFFFTADQFESNIVKSANGLQVQGGNNGGGMWGGNFGGGNWGGDFGGGNWGGNFGGGMWGGFGGGLFSFGGDSVSIIDFMVRRAEVIESALAGKY